MCSSCNEFTKVVCFPWPFTCWLGFFVGFGVGAGLLLGGAVKTLHSTGWGTSCTTSPSPSSCSALKVSDLAGSYSSVGLWLRAGGAAGGALVFSG